jgi:hypothetical protein
MASFSFGFNEDHFEEVEGGNEDVEMHESTPSLEAVRPEKHRLEDLV